MSPAVALLLAVLLLAGNAFFVAAEFALISARRSQIEPKARAGSRLARTTLQALERMPLMIAGIQLGVTLCSLVLGAIAEPAVSHLIEPLFDGLHHRLDEQDVWFHGLKLRLLKGWQVRKSGRGNSSGARSSGCRRILPASRFRGFRRGP